MAAGFSHLRCVSYLPHLLTWARSAQVSIITSIRAQTSLKPSSISVDSSGVVMPFAAYLKSGEPSNIQNSSVFL